MRVLVVDDDPSIASFLTMYLSAAGHEAKVCPDVPAAVEALKEAPVDLVITDVYMQGGSGFHLLATLRKEGETAHTPVVVISGSDKSHLQDAVSNFSRVTLIRKPFGLDDLDRAIEEVLHTE